MKKYLYILVFEILLTVILCFLLAWLNLRQFSISYEISKLSNEYLHKKELNAKLVVERSMLFSPYRLRAMAQSLGFESVDPNMVRKIK